MAHNSLSWSCKLVAASVTGIAVAVALAGCQPRGAVTVTSASAPAVAATTAAAGATAGASQVPDATAAGSVTASISAPISVSGTATTPVACVTGRHYRASASSADIDGDQISFVVAIAGYHGAASYPALVDVTLRQSSGRITTVAGVPNVPAVLTTSGGSFTLSATGAEGRTFTGSLSWTCGS